MKKIIVIAGPTGVGKTALSIHLAEKYHGEILSGDSMQVYKELNIGTAKITTKEMGTIPHHLIDCISYEDEYSVKVFQEKARSIIEDMRMRNVQPIVCGGTGLYIKSLLYDYTFHEHSKDIEFEKFLDTLTNSQLVSILKHVDIKALDNIHPNNRKRLIRALAIAHNGACKSEIIEKQEHKLLYDVYVIGLTMERSTLYERINQRVDCMIENGLFEEISTIVEKHGDAVWSLQSMQSIGYKEWKGIFEGTHTKTECIEMIKKNSRNFAKRQYTWFHNQMPMHWYDVLENGWEQTLYEDLERWIGVDN